MPPAQNATTLHNASVLVTRAEEPDFRLCRMLQESGARPYFLPLVETLALHNTQTPRTIQAHLQCADWLVFSSGNALHHFAELLDSLGLSVGEYGGGYAAVGNQTARLVEGVLGVQCYTPQQNYSLESVLSDILSHQEDTKIWVIGAENGTFERIRGQFPASAQLVHTAVYRTAIRLITPLACAWLEGVGLDWITLTSPSAVRAMLSEGGIFGAVDKAKIATIGASTAAVLHASGIRPEVIAAPQTLAGMLAGIAQFESVGASPSTIAPSRS